jgi:hypothetical protein
MQVVVEAELGTVHLVQAAVVEQVLHRPTLPQLPTQAQAVVVERVLETLQVVMVVQEL